MRHLFLVPLLGTALCVTISRGQSSTITLAELRDLVETSQRSIQRLQIAYSFVQGKVESQDPVQGQFVPNELGMSKGIHAVDFASHDKYFRYDNPMADGKRHIQECAYADKKWTYLGQLEPGDSSQWKAIIDSSSPQIFQEQSLPGVDVGYSVFPGMDLSSCLRMTTEAKIVPALLGGEECYCATLRIEEPSVTSLAGKEVVMQRLKLYRVWLAAKKGTLPIQSEELQFRLQKPEDGATLEALMKCVTGTVRIKRENDVREVEPGIWFPFEIMRYSFRGEGKYYADRISIASALLNEQATVKDKLLLPPNTLVRDNIAKISYRTGLSAEAIEKEVDGLMDSIRTVEANDANRSGKGNQERLLGSVDQPPTERARGRSYFHILTVGVTLILLVSLVLWVQRRARREQE